MPVRFQPTSVIKAGLGIEPNGRVQRFFTHTCRLHMDKYVPYANGDLRRNVTETSDSVIYKTPYAHYMYEGELYVDPETGSSWARKDAIKVPTGKRLRYHTPGTGKYWDKRMWSAEKDKVLQEVQNKLGGK